MNDIIERLRSANGQMGTRDPNEYGITITVAEANQAADEIELLREERDVARSATASLEDVHQKLHNEIKRLRVGLMEMERKVETAEFKDVGHLIAIGRRQGIEAALEVVRKWPPHMVVTTIQAMLDEKS